MSFVRIASPQADQYIELIGASTFPSKLNGADYLATGFDELRLVRGAMVVRWLFDPRTPTGDGDVPDFTPEATATGVFPSGRLELGKDGWVEFKFHVSSPLSPHQKGIWVRLVLAMQGGNLTLLDFSVGRHCATHVVDGPPTNPGAPKWFADSTARWVVDQKRSPSRGNPLLCASVAPDPQLANLVDIDPSRRTDGDDSSLAFVLEPIDGMFEVCTELTAKPQFINSAAVSGHAIGLDFAARASTPFGAAGLHLRCRQEEGRGSWSLQWLDLPGRQTGQSDHALTLESLTSALLDTHALGLATGRSRNRLSLVPISLRTTDSGAVVLHFEATSEANQKVVATRLVGISLTNPAQPLELDCGGALDVDGTPLRIQVQASAQEPASGMFLSWALSPPTVADRPRRIGVGSVLLTLAGFDGGTLQLGFAEDGAAYRRQPLQSALELRFSKASYSALSMDPEVGFETLSAMVGRARPWTVDLLDPQDCLLLIEERANRLQSRLLRLELKLEKAGVRNTDVILVDPSPLTLTRVQTSERQEGREILAEYIDDADQAPEWRFYSSKGLMTATLQAQGIGEEMVKGYLHLDRITGTAGAPVRTRVPADGELFDFRLTPVARLLLDRTDIDMARAEAPWSLRRLLGRRPGAIGVKLTRAEFELLYGLAAKVERSGLRIAELDGFIGRVPFADDLQRAFGPRASFGDDAQRAYATQVAGWLSSLWNRPSWWRVYADIEKRDRLLVDQGVEFRLRPTRGNANPFAIGEYASPDGKAAAPDGREPLRGGVDWPFQSPGVYEEMLDAPVSSSGSVEGLVFGTLGGEGAQTAAFNNGKTVIISSSRQGRLDSLTVIRVGRIAMLWNKARHVIVYERTTRRAPRYDGDEPEGQHDTLELQPPFSGIAALRKVREYVEITEPRRRYPDSDSAPGINGPLVQSVFASTAIPVRSDWGRDIRDGFVMSLRGPIPDGFEPAFPDPKVFLDFARAADKGEGQIAQRIASTQRLTFFTSTRAKDSGDSDTWPAWPDVDFPLLPPSPAPDLPFRSSFQGRNQQPDAAPVELGMAPFTFELDPSEEAIDLMHGRRGPGLEAKLFNINLARGLPADSGAHAWSGQPLVGAFANAQSLLLDGLGELKAELRERVAAGDDASLAARPQLQQDVRLLLSRLQTAVGGMPSPVAAPQVDWQGQQAKRSQAYVAGVTRDAKSLGEQMLAQASVLGGDLQQARNQACALADAIAQQAVQRVGELGFVPQQALAAARGMVDDLTGRLRTRFAGLSGDLLRTIMQLRISYKHDPESATELEMQWRATVGDLPGQLRHVFDVLDQVMDGSLGEWFSRLAHGGTDTFYARVHAQVDAELTRVADWLQRWADALAPFDVAPPDFDAMEGVITQVVGQQLAGDLLAKVRDFLAGLWEETRDWDAALQKATSELAGLGEALGDRLKSAGSVEELRSFLQEYADKLPQELAGAAHDVSAGIDAKLAGLSFSGLQGSLDALAGFKTATTDALTAIETALQGTVGDLERAVRERAATAESYVHAGARQIEDWARQELGPTIGIATRNANAGLETLRMLAEGPVTDALRVSRERLGYYCDKSTDVLGVTRAGALFNELGQDALNSLSAYMPFDRIRDRLLPRLENLAVRDLFPDFCGIKLTYFLPDLDVELDGSHEYDWIRLQHGFDKDTLRAWAKVSVDKQFESDATLFDLGPVKLRLLVPHFVADSDIQFGQDGTRRQRTKATLGADFELSLNGKPMVTLRKGSLSFDERGELNFDFDSDRLELAPELQFVTEALQAMMPQVDGMTVTPLLPSGVSAALSLPLPDIGTGAFTLTGITLNTHLDLKIAEGFEIGTGLWLSKPDRPFGLAVLFLGGGGWFGIDATYKPPERFVTRVSIGVSAGAFVAVNFGYASGSAGILFTASVDFYRDWQAGNGSTAVSLGILIWGEFSVMGIASASIRLILRITYDDSGGMVGTGTFSVSIRICWCFTLRVSREARKEFAQGSSGQRGNQRMAAAAKPAPTALAAAPLAAPIAAPSTSTQRVEVGRDGKRYGDLAPTDAAAAVNDYFDTLAVVRSAP